MSPSAVDSAESQWLAQLAAMRTAISELKLPPTTNGVELSYGSDIEFDDEDFSSGNSGDDVWDFISDSEGDIYSSDFDDSHDAMPSSSYGRDWLQAKCVDFASRREGLSATDLQAQLEALLASDSAENELQSLLTDIVGFDDLDLVIELISHRHEIVALPLDLPRSDDGLLGKLQTRKEREEALRRRDFEHKNTVLGPALNRDGPDYPHVYKAHSAGNSLSAGGKKYGLPDGSERKEREVSISTSTPTRKREVVLTAQRNMRNTLYQRVRLAHLVQDGGSLRSLRWMDCVRRPSKAINL